ncbi:MAG: TIGR04282 family arsenosugar biosynthesis glycosyltransferase [Syntrophotaleaceae bacterium]
MTGNALGIFAKEPVPGRVKTRLCPPLSLEQAAELYDTCLQETVAAMAAAPAERIIFYDGDAAYFTTTFPGLRLIRQSDGDLGRRMDRALHQLLTEGNRAAVLIGSDSPDLPLSLVTDAFATLADYDLAVAPARDGGYVLIGESRHTPELFQDMPWSNDNLWSKTRHRAEQLDLAYRELPPWEDLDDPASLARLRHRAPQSPTARLARRFLNNQARPGSNPMV